MRYEVRGYLPEVAVLVGVGEQVIENVVDGDGPVEVERDATDRHHDDDEVQDVPEGLEVRQTQLLDLASQRKLLSLHA